MTHTERIRNMVEHKPVDRVGISGWVHMPMVDRNVKDFTKATIDLTDNMNWDFIKLMSNGHYFAGLMARRSVGAMIPRSGAVKFCAIPCALHRTRRISPCWIPRKTRCSSGSCKSRKT